MQFNVMYRNLVYHNVVVLCSWLLKKINSGQFQIKIRHYVLAFSQHILTSSFEVIVQL